MMNDYNQNFNRNPQPPKKERSPYLTKKMGAILAALCILASGSAGFAGGVLMKSRLTARLPPPAVKAFRLRTALLPAEPPARWDIHL